MQLNKTEGLKKILYIISSSDIGGGEKVLLSLLKYLDKDKFDVFVACPSDGPMFEDFKRYAREVRTFNFRNWLNPLTILSLKKYMKEKQFDIVHTHLYSADFMGIIAARLVGIPCRISTIHGHNFSSTGQIDLRSIRNLIFSFIYRALYIFCNKIIAVSQSVREGLIRRPGIKVDKRKIDVIYSGFELEELLNHEDVSNNKIDDQGFKSVGVIANFDRVKGHRVLLKAIPEILSEIKDVRFLFAGDGKEKNSLQRLATKLKVKENVFFLGICHDVPRLINSCELIVVPSVMEGLSLVILESIAVGKPVVASRVGGISELVKENENAILVPPWDHRELSRAIIKILKNKEVGLAMRQKNREILQRGFYNKFSARYMTKEIERLYHQCLKRKAYDT
jgi:glycosyltransferase involved in cell wall biosynthesis